MSTRFNRKGKAYYIIARNGKTSKTPFPHETLNAAKEEAIRLAKAFNGSSFTVLKTCFKVAATKEGDIIRSFLRYKKPVEKKVLV